MEICIFYMKDKVCLLAIKFKFAELRKSGVEENNEWQHGVV